MSTHLWRTQGGLANDFYLFSVYFTLHKPTFLCFWTKRRFNTTAVWNLPTNHERVVAWYVASGHSLPIAADEGWHSLKRPYRTVAVNSWSVFTEVSTPILLQKDITLYTYVSENWRKAIRCLIHTTGCMELKGTGSTLWLTPSAMQQPTMTWLHFQQSRSVKLENVDIQQLGSGSGVSTVHSGITVCAGISHKPAQILTYQSLSCS